MTGCRFPVRWAGSLAVVTLPAEIDAANARELDTELGSLLTLGASPLVVDLTQTRFCDSSGIAALVRARKRAGVLGTGLRVAVTPGPVTRVLQVLGADRLLQLFCSLDAALAEAPRVS